MNTIRHSRTLAVALAATLSLAGCSKEEAAAPPEATPAPAPTPAPTPAPAPAPAPAAPASVTGVLLGNAPDASGQVLSDATEFAATDAITASVSTTTSDPAVTVPGTLTAKWIYQDGQLVSEQSRAVSFTGPGVTNFQISKPDGWPAGKYTLEVSLDGTKVQTREITDK